ncbi:NAD-dependent epimerase/dehydratase family protein [Pacificimonas sp. ICDLI1SI03]
MIVAVTGSTGFVGQHLTKYLEQTGIQTIRVGRASGPSVDRAVGDFAPATDFADALAGADAVIHLANRAHVMNETVADPEAEYDRINHLATAKLARDAVRAGVRRFVFVSSIKVNGETATEAQPFRADDEPAPADAYGRSKLAAERALAKIAQETGLEVVVIRPPLIYGPGVKANFAALIESVLSGSSLPRLFGAAENPRAMIDVGLFSEALVRTVRHPKASGRTFLVADPVILPLNQLIRELFRASGRDEPLFPVPTVLLRMAGLLTGQGERIRRLLDPLSIEQSEFFRFMQWHPDKGHDLERTVAWFRNHISGTGIRSARQKVV